MCSVQGSAHYKMILVNYLELAIYCMAGVDSQDGMPAFLSESERRGQSFPGSVLHGQSGGSLIVGVPGKAGSRPSRTPHL